MNIFTGIIFIIIIKIILIQLLYDYISNIWRIIFYLDWTFMLASYSYK